MSKKSYMMMDLIFLGVVGIVLEVLGIIIQIEIVSRPDNFWFISLNTIFILIAMFRWNWYGLLLYLPLTLATCIVYQIFDMIDPSQYFIYLMGTAFIGFNLLWFKLFAKKVMSKRFGYCVLYSITGYLLIALGRSIVALFTGIDLTLALKSFIFGDAFSIIMGVLIMMIVYAQHSILVDINSYLVEVQESGK